MRQLLLLASFVAFAIAATKLNGTIYYNRINETFFFKPEFDRQGVAYGSFEGNSFN